MAKIGSVQVEIAPHISDEALQQIADKIAEAVERGIRQGALAAPLVFQADSFTFQPKQAAAQVTQRIKDAQATHGVAQ